MHLIVCDEDSHYLSRFREEFSKQMDKNIELICAGSLEEIEKLNCIKSQTFFVVHQDMAKDFFSLPNSLIKTIISKKLWIILSEGSYEIELLELIQSLGIEESECEKFFVHKYQLMRDIVDIIKEKYICYNSCYLVHTKYEAKLISVYTPYGSMEVTQKMNDLRLKIHPSHKILIIHYDAFYQDEDTCQFNLSYLFTQIKRGKKNLSFIINELSIKKGGQISILRGPFNMLDVDSLSKEEFRFYLHWLKEQSMFQTIIFNFNGVHISEHVLELLKSSRCVLVTNNDLVQQSVQRQFSMKWHLCLDNESNVLEQLIKEEE